MLRRSTGLSLEMKRVGVSMARAMPWAENCKWLAWESGHSSAPGSSDALGMKGWLLEMALRRRTRGSWSAEAMMGGLAMGLEGEEVMR